MNELKVTLHNINELIPDPGNARLHDRRNIDDFDLFFCIKYVIL